jgi:hypothetical protein
VNTATGPVQPEGLKRAPVLVRAEKRLYQDRRPLAGERHVYQDKLPQ